MLPKAAVLQLEFQAVRLNRTCRYVHFYGQSIEDSGLAISCKCLHISRFPRRYGTACKHIEKT